MTNDTNQDIERALRDAFRELKPDQAQAIRIAYYKAAEGLLALARELELADLDLGEGDDRVLLQEHFIACDALNTLHKSMLARIL